MLRKPMDQKGHKPEEKKKVNIEEGRGISLERHLKGLGRTNYEFSTANPMWRASLWKL